MLPEKIVEYSQLKHCKVDHEKVLLFGTLEFTKMMLLLSNVPNRARNFARPPLSPTCRSHLRLQNTCYYMVAGGFRDAGVLMVWVLMAGTMWSTRGCKNWLKMGLEGRGDKVVWITWPALPPPHFLVWRWTPVFPIPAPTITTPAFLSRVVRPR